MMTEARMIFEYMTRVASIRAIAQLLVKLPQQEPKIQPRSGGRSHSQPFESEGNNQQEVDHNLGRDCRHTRPNRSPGIIQRIKTGTRIFTAE